MKVEEIVIFSALIPLFVTAIFMGLNAISDMTEYTKKQK